jgi:hypothetical protein
MFGELDEYLALDNVKVAQDYVKNLKGELLKA